MVQLYKKNLQNKQSGLSLKKIVSLTFYQKRVQIRVNMPAAAVNELQIHVIFQ